MVTIPSLNPSQKKLWLAAIKPPMYSVAIMPILVGTAVAFAEKHSVNLEILGIFLLAAILILAWENLSNDVFDSETGIDKNKAHSLVNLTGNKSLVFWLANLCLGLGIFGIIAISWWQQDPTVLGIILFSCFLGYTYQGPPFRLGYQGLGELICFFAFGPIGISAAYYAQTQSFSALSLTASLIIGISTSIILFCSHFHQVEDDMTAGKRSPIVRLGTEKGYKVLIAATWSIYILTLFFVGIGIYPLGTLLIFASFPLALKLVNHVREYHNQPAKVSNCKFLAVNLHFVSGFLFAIGFILGF